MRRSIVLLTMVAAVVLAFSAAALAEQAEPTSSQPSSAEDFVPGEVLVKFEPGATGQDIANIHRQNGGQVKEVIGGIDVQVVGVPPGQEKTSVARYQHNPNVRYAELNGVYEATGSVPNDPKVGQQWAFNNTGQTVGTTVGTADADINAFEAWNGGSTTDWKAGTTGSAAVPIAVLDTGIYEDHEDLKGKVTKRIKHVSIFDSPTNGDVQGHGTHVAGTVAALTDNGEGVAGTCPGCVLYNVKVMGDDGKGETGDIVNGIIWSADNGAKVINMSLGSYSDSTTMQLAVNYAWGKGVVLVASAGNDDTYSPHYPAAYENVIAVGATDSKDQKASYSNFGLWVDVAAPGSNILSTINKVDDPLTTTVDESYERKFGTSMASPHVAGLAGLLASKGYSNSEIRNRIEKTAIDLGTTGKDGLFGYGRIDARDAFVCVPDTCPPIVKPPVKSISASSQLVNTSTVPVNLNWFSSDRGGSGIARYELQKSTNGSAWSNVTLLSPTANSPTLYLGGDSTYRFRVRAQDNVGNWSTWAEGSTFKVHKPYQENNPAVSYPRGTWTTSISSAASGGYFKGSTTCFATAKFSFTGSEVAWVAIKGLAFGKVQVRVDGVSSTVVDLSSGTAQARSTVFQKRWSSPGAHTIEVTKTVDYINPKTGYMSCDPLKGVNVDAFTVLG